VYKILATIPRENRRRFRRGTQIHIQPAQKSQDHK
jgi:hypothetical protein